MEIKKEKSIEFILNPESSNLKGCDLVTGFYGVGKIGFIAVNHMIQKMKAKRIGYILTEEIPPFISVKDEKLILPFQIYKSGNVVFIIAHFEPYKQEHKKFARAVIHWAVENELNQMILIGGLDSRLRKDENILAKAVYTSKYRLTGASTSIDTLDEGLFVSGPLALLLMYCEVYDFPAIGVLPYAERSRPDPIGASNAVVVINDLLWTNCGVEELIEEAEDIEREISAMMDASENPSNEDLEDTGSDKGLFM